VVRHRNRLPKEVVDDTSLEGLKVKVDLGSEQPDLVEYVPACCRWAWTRRALKVPSNPNYCTILLSYVPSTFFL